MKGCEIIALYNKASKDVKDIHGMPGGEIGDCLRGKGYSIFYNGCSVCRFEIRGLYLGFIADCCDTPWEVKNWIGIGPYKEDGSHRHRVEDIDPDKDYDIPEDPSYAELFASGRLMAKSFIVEAKGGDKLDNRGSFDDFSKADEFAKSECQKEIEICERDPDWRRHASRKVVNDEQRAKERCELRHYEYYNYQGHRYWISVQPEEYEILIDKQKNCI